MDGLMAWHGIVKMHEARWTDKDGSAVTFKLPMSKEAEERRNPFVKFTKRRKGTAGTRFYMSCAYVGATGEAIIYKDEVMLCGWNDSQSTGHTVKFWLASDEMGHPFEGFERSVDEFAVSLVELDDDNEPIDQKIRDRIEKAGVKPSQRLSYVAAMFCKSEEFYNYLSTLYPNEGDEFYSFNDAFQFEEMEGWAREWMCKKLSIKSRAELDDQKNEAAINGFHRIRQEFVQWQYAENRAVPPF